MNCFDIQCIVEASSFRLNLNMTLESKENYPRHTKTVQKSLGFMPEVKPLHKPRGDLVLCALLYPKAGVYIKMRYDVTSVLELGKLHVCALCSVREKYTINATTFSRFSGVFKDFLHFLQNLMQGGEKILVQGGEKVQRFFIFQSGS